MTYIVKLENYDDRDLFKMWLHRTLPESRFKCEIRNVFKPHLTLHQIRLKTSKPYCGHHAGPCRLLGKHRKGNFLEGADWVGFNDMLNDILDRLDLSADVYSVACVVRQGKKRCVEYMMGNKGEWEKYGVYENCCKQKAPITEYPDGTPGIADWKANADKEYV